MITKIKFGEPVNTGAVVLEVSVSQKIDFGNVVSTWPFRWDFQLSEEDKVFGLGESMRGINKRGFKYTSWCSDEPHQDESKPSLYGAHNFIIVFGKQTFGMFFETPSRIDFDIGFTKADLFSVETQDIGVNLYTITAEKDGQTPLLSIVQQFRTIIGQSYIPPFWAFGFQQSRWGYKNQQDISEVVQNYKKMNFPIDSVCMDIDYMEEYEDFTVDKEKFPDLSQFAAELKKDGIRLIPIIDAGVKVKEGYSVYDEGIKNEYFCKKEDGKTPYAAGVWPGRSHFADFFRPEVRKWFGLKYKVLTDCGIEGFWNDMNEPAMFYSDESLSQAHEKMKNTDVTNLDIISFFQFSALGESTKNSMEDYKRFYHSVPADPKNPESDRKIYRHDKVHNMFGGLMTQAAAEGLDEIAPEKRMLLYSRASTIGAHRYGGIWTGDVNSWWAHLEQHIKVLPGLNMCGFLYTGSDIGGFGYDTSRDLLLRWTEFSVFTPLMRNHSSAGTRLQEYYRYENPEDFKSVLDLRYALIPYLYSEYVKCAVKNQMMFKPLGFEYPSDKMAMETEDQLFLGNEIMLAPVYKQNATGRYVYLPENMTKVIWQNSTFKQERMKKGIHYVQMPLNSVVFFVRDKKMIPLCKPASSTNEIKYDDFEFVGDGKEYLLYRDDGFTKDIQLEKGCVVVKK